MPPPPAPDSLDGGGGGSGGFDLDGGFPPPPGDSMPPLPGDPGGGDFGGGFGSQGLSEPPGGIGDGPSSDDFGGGFGGNAGDDFGEAPIPQEASSPEASNIERQAGGGVGYGEVNLGGGEEGGGSLGLDSVPPRTSGAMGDDDMEFGAIPQEDAPDEEAKPAARPGAGQLHVQQVDLEKQKAEAKARKRRSIVRSAIAAGTVIVVGGAALELLPDVGLFGRKAISDVVNADSHSKTLQSTETAAQKSLAQDTYPLANKAFSGVDAAHRASPRFKPLKAYAAYVGFLKELRFGHDTKVNARAKVLLEELKESQPNEVQHLGLARAARAGVDGQLARAKAQLSTLARQNPKSIDVAVTLAEIELRGKDAKAAVAAWTKAIAIEKSARTSYGLARAQYAAGMQSEAIKNLESALEQSKGHAGARILLAQIHWTKSHNEEQAIKLLEAIEKNKSASPEEVVRSQTLLGEVHLSRSRVTHAEKAFQKALKISPKAGGALAGLGDALYQAGRYSEALARFQAGIQAEPDNITAKLGVAKTQIALERLEEAHALTKKLAEAHKEDPRVLYWAGQVEDALGNRKEAEKRYRQSIEKGKDSPDTVSSYVALAMLLNQQGRGEEAEKQLATAREKMPNSPAIQQALGDVAMSQGRYDEAVAHFKKAVSLDAEDLGSLFSLGVALAKDRKFEDAKEAFKKVAETDAEYPGLALERGNLFEAAGESAQALKEYEAALAKAPKDLDLKLRVGCAKVSAQRGAEAEKLLRQVLTQRPNSGEVNHCLGRALLQKGGTLAEALKMLERARDLSKNRAEYHLYVGMAANEAGDGKKAEESLRRALQLDQGLADAYWQRGVLRTRQGAVKDAIEDLEKALELRPSRFEAHADLADALREAGREQDAIGEWEKAIAKDGNNPTWRYRYGRLLSDNRRAAEARTQLAKAIELGEKEKPKPRWVWEAHRMYAMALGNTPAAIPHWEAFLRDGQRDSAYRPEAKAALKRLGKPWDGP